LVYINQRYFNSEEAIHRDGRCVVINTKLIPRRDEICESVIELPAVDGPDEESSVVKSFRSEDEDDAIESVEVLSQVVTMSSGSNKPPVPNAKAVSFPRIKVEFVRLT